MKTHWLNKERTLFLAAGLWLAFVTHRFVQERPEADPFGPQTVKTRRPERVEVTLAELSADHSRDLKLFTVGPRPNPFNVYWHEADLAASNFVEVIQVADQAPTPKPIAPKPPPPPPPPPPPAEPPEPKPDEKPDPTTTEPPPYMVPVDYQGYIAAGGQFLGTLRDKDTGELMEVREGTYLPSYGLTVRRITRSGILFENDNGDRIRVRDVSSLPDEPDLGE